MKDLFLIIDMQKVYREGQPWECRNINTVIKNILRILPAGQAALSTLPDSVVFTRYIAPADPVGTWKRYNQHYAAINADPVMSELIDEFKPFTSRYPVFDKTTYSSCTIPQLQELLQNVKRVVIAGVVAQCCVLATLIGLIDRGIEVVYLKDAVAGQNQDSEQMTEAIVDSFSPIHTKIMTVNEYLDS